MSAHCFRGVYPGHVRSFAIAWRYQVVTSSQVLQRSAAQLSLPRCRVRDGQQQARSAIPYRVPEKACGMPRVNRERGAHVGDAACARLCSGMPDSLPRSGFNYNSNDLHHSPGSEVWRTMAGARPRVRCTECGSMQRPDQLTQSRPARRRVWISCVNCDRCRNAAHARVCWHTWREI